ncbi:MAG: U32 family peptidase [Bacteroidetes bacterium]|nr:MAG: U32 family peptidase [Bacteroidota bacterium]
MNRREDIDLLAPAGNFESLTAAAQGGADSVYFGIEQLNMRARSTVNFTTGDLPMIVDRAGELGLKSYLALNAVVYEREIPRMQRIVDLAVRHGVSAIIASDPSVLLYCNRAGARVHLSTQLNITNAESLKFYSRFADVAVLARELDLDQVQGIIRTIGHEDIRGSTGERMRIEMFIHGALCMAVSGKCYLSLHEHNHSANRGDCYQVCRRGYTVTDREREVELDIDNEYIMSPKDLKTIHFLDRILEAGVQVLKIEGRARSAEYVSTVTACYSEAIRAWLDGTYGLEKIAGWDERLSRVFNRGFWDGYYLGRRLGEWSRHDGSAAVKRKVYVGKGINYFDRIGVAEITIESGTLALGDEILIIGPTTGVIETTVRELRVGEENRLSAVRGDRCSFPVEQVVRRSDRVYKMVDREP